MNASSETTPSARAAKRPRRKAAAADSVAVAAPVLLPADNGMDEIGPLQALLAPRLDDAELTLDGSQVQRVHTGAMQLFLMFCRDRAAAGRTTVWHNPSANLHAAARVLGLTHALQLSREPS